MLFRQDIQHKKLFRLAIASFLLAIVVVVLGAFTRLVDAGLGCPDWPGCYGHLLWPNETHEIQKAEAAFPDAPVELDKTWPEMVHRYFAGTLGLFVLAIAIISFRNHKQTPHQNIPYKHALFLLALIILQGAFGAWTVTLKLWPKVVTAHLLGGFATLSLLWLLGQRLGGERWVLSANQYNRLLTLRPFLVVATVLVILQIALGGWVSSNYAALACPDFPQCLGTWLPPMDIQKGFNVWQDIGPNYLGGQLDNHSRTAIHFFHRIGALIVLIALLIQGYLLYRINTSIIRRWVLLLWAVLFLQLALGVSNIIFALPLAVAVAHNAIGALLLLVMVSLLYRVFTAQLLTKLQHTHELRS